MCLFWQRQLKALASSDYLGPATKAVHVQFVVYNPALNAMGRLSFSAHISLAGFLSTEYSTNTIPFDIYNGQGQQSWQFRLEILWLLLLVYHMLSLLQGARRSYDFVPL